MSAHPHGVPTTMRALMYRGARKLEVVELPVAAFGTEDALLEVSHCGICGTDLHVVLEGMSPPDRVGGHEYSARVVAVGSEVDGSEDVSHPLRAAARERTARRWKTTR